MFTFVQYRKVRCRVYHFDVIEVLSYIREQRFDNWLRCAVPFWYYVSHCIGGEFYSFQWLYVYVLFKCCAGLCKWPGGALRSTTQMIKRYGQYKEKTLQETSNPRCVWCESGCLAPIIASRYEPDSVTDSIICLSASIYTFQVKYRDGISNAGSVYLLEGLISDHPSNILHNVVSTLTNFCHYLPFKSVVPCTL